MPNSKAQSTGSSSACRKLLGVAIPAYKRETMLARLLDSIVEGIPVVVSDNGGHLSQKFKDRYPLVQFVVAEEVAALENWNRVVNAMEAEWIVMPGDDDIYYPDSFTKIISAIRCESDSDILFFGHNIIDEEDRIKTTWRPTSRRFTAPHGFDAVRNGTEARPPGIVFKADLFHRLDGFSTDFKVTAGDNHFYQRATLVGNVTCVDEVVAGYRVWEHGSTNMTIATNDWLREVDLWCSRVRIFAKEHGNYHYPRSLQDEIYLANLLVGIHVLKGQSGYWAPWRHFFSSRYPVRASIVHQLELFIYLLKPKRLWRG